MATHCLKRCPECKKLNLVGGCIRDSGHEGEHTCNAPGGTTHSYTVPA
jgi:hypothetical protein